MKAQPVTISDQLMDRINALYRAGGRYVSRSDFEFRRLLRDCDDLIRVDSVHGHVLRGVAHSLVADIEHIKEDVGHARAIAGEDVSYCDYMLAQALVRLGYFSEAQPLFVSSADPMLGRFSSRSVIGIAAGAINALAGMFKEADRLNLSYKTAIDREEIDLMLPILNDSGVDDAQFAAMLDVAGKVARNRCIRIQQHQTRVVDCDGDRFVLANYLVDCSPREAADMVFELSDELAVMDKITPAVHVSFECV